MALDPSIALGVRPPVLQPLQIQSPLERYQKVLTLRGMMEQQQLRGLQMQQAEQELAQTRQTREGQAEFQRRLLAGETLTPGQSIGMLGPKVGVDYLKSQTDAEKAKLDRITQLNTIHVNNAKRRAQIAAGVSDLEGAKKAVWQTYQEQAFDPDPAKNSLIARDVLEHLQNSGFNADEWKQHAQESMDYAARQELANKEEEEKRKFAKAPFELRSAEAGATKAEQEATGTQPITLQQKAQAEAQLWGDPGGLIAITNDPNRSEADRRRAAAGLDKHMGLRRAGAATTSVITPNQNIDNESKLRNDYTKDTKEYVTMRNARNKVVGAAAAADAGNPTADISLIYSFMKLQDPGSAIMQGDLANATNAGGVPERIRVMYNNAVRGEKLDANTRKGFVEETERIHNQAYADYLKTKEMYTGIAQRSGMNPLNVVIDYSTASLPTVTLKDGRTATFPSGAAAEAFKKDNPGLVK